MHHVACKFNMAASWLRYCGQLCVFVFSWISWLVSESEMTSYWVYVFSILFNSYCFYLVTTSLACCLFLARLLESGVLTSIRGVAECLQFNRLPSGLAACLQVWPLAFSFDRLPSGLAACLQLWPLAFSFDSLSSGLTVYFSYGCRHSRLNEGSIVARPLGTETIGLLDIDSIDLDPDSDFESSGHRNPDNDLESSWQPNPGSGSLSKCQPGSDDNWLLNLRKTGANRGVSNTASTNLQRHTYVVMWLASYIDIILLCCTVHKVHMADVAPRGDLRTRTERFIRMTWLG